MNSQKNLSSRSKYVYAFLINLTKSLIFFTKRAYTFLKNLPSKTKFVISLVLVFMFSSASFLLIINAVDNSLNGFGSSYVNFSMPSFTSTNDIFAEFKPKVNISFSYHGDDAVTCNTYKITVSEFLNTMEISLEDTDVLSHALDDVLEDDMLLSIDRVEFENTDRTERISYETENYDVTTVPKGKSSVITKGEYGVYTRTYRQKYVNGKFDSEELISEGVTKKPVTEVVHHGIGGTFTAPDGTKYNYSYCLDVTATAYTDGTGEDGTGERDVTATGMYCDVGIIAVDRKVIPLGSKVYVIGSYGDYGVCDAQDVGGAIKGNKIDVCVGGSEQVARQFGVRKMKAYILE